VVCFQLGFLDSKFVQNALFPRRKVGQALTSMRWEIGFLLSGQKKQTFCRKIWILIQFIALWKTIVFWPLEINMGAKFLNVIYKCIIYPVMIAALSWHFWQMPLSKKRNWTTFLIKGSQAENRQK